MMAEMFGTLPPMWQIQMEFEAPGIGLDRPRCCGIWSVNQQVESLSSYLSRFAFMFPFNLIKTKFEKKYSVHNGVK